MRILLKLGGSLITNKDKPFSARKDIIARIAWELRGALQENPDMELLIGHGSGSFGHFAAKDYGTREQVTTQQAWQGFQKVWYAARALNQIVVEIFHQAELPVISMQPSSAIHASNRKVEHWTTEPIQSALVNHLLPLIYGDVIFDAKKGGIIFSTEDLFRKLSSILKPDLIILAGIEQGVYKDFPKNTELIKVIDTKNYKEFVEKIKASSSTDVTGGMASKVQVMMEIVRENPGTIVRIISGEQSGMIQKALRNEEIGTNIRK